MSRPCDTSISKEILVRVLSKIPTSPCPPFCCTLLDLLSKQIPKSTTFQTPVSLFFLSNSSALDFFFPPIIVPHTQTSSSHSFLQTRNMITFLQSSSFIIFINNNPSSSFCFSLFSNSILVSQPTT